MSRVIRQPRQVFFCQQLIQFVDDLFQVGVGFFRGEVALDHAFPWVERRLPDVLQGLFEGLAIIYKIALCEQRGELNHLERSRITEVFLRRGRFTALGRTPWRWFVWRKILWP